VFALWVCSETKDLQICTVHSCQYKYCSIVVRLLEYTIFEFLKSKTNENGNTRKSKNVYNAGDNKRTCICRLFLSSILTDNFTVSFRRWALRWNEISSQMCRIHTDEMIISCSNSPFKESQGLLPCSQKFATGHHTELLVSSHHRIHAFLCLDLQVSWGFPPKYSMYSPHHTLSDLYMTSIL
jgi:hypothetical protein